MYITAILVLMHDIYICQGSSKNGLIHFKSPNHRITKLQELEGASRDHQSNLPAKAGILQ